MRLPAISIAAYLTLTVLTLASGCHYEEPRDIVASAQIDASDVTLNLFTREYRELLQRHLASSAAWRVTRDPATGRGTLSAIRREQTARGWDSRLHGNITYYPATNPSQTRTAIRLEKDSTGRQYDSWYSEGVIGSSPVELKLARFKRLGPSTDLLESYLILKANDGVALEIFEEGNGMDRAFTHSTLNAVNGELSSIVNSETAKARGFNPALLPETSIKMLAKPELVIEESFQKGIYRVSGYVNPGRSGNIYVRVFRTTDGADAMDRLRKERTVEYVGWSDNPNEMFFFQVEAMCTLGDWDHEYPARFEVWFHPSDGPPETLLVQGVRNIYGWER